MTTVAPRYIDLSPLAADEVAWEIDQEAVQRLFAHAAHRVATGEDQDPCMAVTAALCRGENVHAREVLVILRAHENGPWMVSSADDLAIFKKWCEAAGEPVQIGEPVEIEGLPVYRDDAGDCVLAEAARGSAFAVWTRKGRLQVGFREEADAVKFRSFRNGQFSVANTGNKNVGLVVLDGKADDAQAYYDVALALQGVWRTSTVLPQRFNANGLCVLLGLRCKTKLPGGDKLVQIYKRPQIVGETPSQFHIEGRRSGQLKKKKLPDRID